GVQTCALPILREADPAAAARGARRLPGPARSGAGCAAAWGRPAGVGARRVVARGPHAGRAAAARSAPPVRSPPALAAQTRTEPAWDRSRAAAAAASGAPWRKAAAARARRLPARPGSTRFRPDEAGSERPGPDRDARAAQQQFVEAQL